MLWLRLTLVISFVLVDEIDYVWLVEGVSCGLVVSGQAMALLV